VIEPAPPYRGEGPHALRHVIASTLDFSGIRLRNASMAA
jgi:hypothetical protein